MNTIQTEKTMNTPVSGTGFFKKILGATALLACCAVPSLAQPPIDLAATSFDVNCATALQYRMKWQDNRQVSGVTFAKDNLGTLEAPYLFGIPPKTITKDADGYIVSINAGMNSSNKGMFILNKFYPEGKTDATAIAVFQYEYVHPTLDIRPAVVKTDAYNNIYVAGGSASGQGFLTKFDAAGKVVWEKTYINGEFYDLAIYNGKGVPSDLCIYGIIDYNTSISSGEVVKYNASGTKLWNANCWTGLIISIAVDEVSASSILTPAGHRVYITGGYGTDHSSSIAKAASVAPANGSAVWQDSFTGGSSTIASNRNFGRKVTTDGAGRVFVLADVYTDDGGDDAGLLRYSISPAIGTDGEAKPFWFVKHDCNDGYRYDKDVVDMEIRPDGSEIFLLVNIYDYAYSSNVANYNARVIKCSNTGSRVWASSTLPLNQVAKYGVDLELLPNGKIAYLSNLLTSSSRVARSYASVGLTVLCDVSGQTSSESAAPYIAPGNTQTVGTGLCVDANNDMYVNGYSVNNPVREDGKVSVLSTAASNIAFKAQPKTEEVIDGPLRRFQPEETSSMNELATTYLYPNPSKGNATLYFGSDVLKQINVYAFDGKLVKSLSTTDNAVVLHLEGAAAGMYSVQVITDKDRSLYKMIIE